MKKLQLADLKVGQAVYVKYDRSYSTWFNPEYNVDGMELVGADEKGLYLIDRNGGKLHDLDHYLEVEAIEIFTPDYTADNKQVKILEVQEVYGTELEECSSWYYFKALQNGKIIESYTILEEELPEEEAEAMLKAYVEASEFVDIKSMSPDLRELVENCHHSDNEMWFVDEDEAEYYTEELRKDLEAEVERLGLENHVTFDTEDSLITVWGGISMMVNFHE